MNPEQMSALRDRINNVPIVATLEMETVCLDHGFCETRTPRRLNYDGIFRDSSRRNFDDHRGYHGLLGDHDWSGFRDAAGYDRYEYPISRSLPKRRDCESESDKIRAHLMPGRSQPFRRRK
jgi:hypothetical protein